MKLVADTNIIVAALLKTGATQNIIFNSELEIYSPDYVLEEIANHRAEYLKKAGYAEERFEKIMKIVFSRIKVVERKEYSEGENRIKAEIPDKNDWPFVALSFALNCPLWSNDKLLKEQKICEVLNTGEMIGLLEKRKLQT